MTGVPAAHRRPPSSAMPATALHADRRRAVHRPDPGGQRGRRQGAAADHAVQGGGDELLQDEAGADRSSRTPSPRTASARRRWCRRREMLGAAGDGHLHLQVRRPLRHEPGRSWSSGTASSSGDMSVADLTSGCRSITDNVREDDSITKIRSSDRDRLHDARPEPHRPARPRGRAGRAPEADVRLRQLLRSCSSVVPLPCSWCS